MLRFLSIKRLAVIDAVEIEFEPGLNVLTGETGAGKSILVEAVGLLLGGRSSGDLVRTGEEAATIEAIFEHDGAEVIVRREITAQGRSRAFVNGELVTAARLRELSDQLVELHGQHEHETLLDRSTHLALIDDYGRLGELTARMAASFEAMRATRDEVDRVRAIGGNRATRRDLVAFQLDELDRARLRAGEDEELGVTRQVLASAERLTRLCAEAYAALYERDDAVLAELGHVWRRVSELASLDATFQPYVDAREGVKSQLEDLALFLRRYRDGIDAAPGRLQVVEERLALLERLKRKYGPALADVIEHRAALRAELGDLEGSEERLADLERRHSATRAAYVDAAATVGQRRREIAVELSRQLERHLAELAMEQTRVEARFETVPMPEARWGPLGMDVVEFLVSPNPGEELRPLTKIVSGGELSRIMLALKTLMASTRRGFSDASDRPASSAAPGLIFDEVDAGIGGRVADVVGRHLRALGSIFQVLCITHVPQIAAYADTHFQIVKMVERGRTWTTVARLTREGQIEELARMLGGEAVTAGVRASAREMIESRRTTALPAPEGESERRKAKPAGRVSERVKP